MAATEPHVPDLRALSEAARVFLVAIDNAQDAGDQDATQLLFDDLLAHARRLGFLLTAWCHDELQLTALPAGVVP